MKHLFTLIWSIFITTTLAAQTGSLKGYVQTPDGKAAEYVNVKIKGASVGTATDANGEYQLQNLQPGSYTLQFSFVSMQPQEKEVQVKAGETTQVSRVVLQESQAQLRQVEIIGTSSNTYKTTLPSGSLRIPGRLVDAPQNIQVVPKQLLLDQQAVNMLEGVSRNVSGVLMVEHWGNFARVNMRGFKVPAFRNGMNVDLPWGPLTEDMAMVERIEFVKGPAGFMLSSGEPGGLYNVVTKKPEADQQQSVNLSAGSYNFLRSTVDVGGKLSKDGRLLYRFNLMGGTQGSHRDYEYNHRYTLAPSLKYQLNDKTSLTAEWLHQYSQLSVVGAAYVFSPNGFGDLSRNFTLTEPNLEPTVIRENNVFVNLEHALNDNWQVNAQLSYLHFKQVGSSMWPDSMNNQGGMIRGVDIWDALNESKLGQVFVQGKAQTGAVKHQVLAGLDLGQKDYYADWFQGASLDPKEKLFNIYQPVWGIPGDQLPQYDRSKSIRQRAYGSYAAIVGQRYSSLYVQDELSFFKNLARLTLAGRYTHYSGWSYGSNTNDQVFSPRLGLSITLVPNTSLYGLYDQSFIPQAGATPEGEAFVPVRANNLEAGLKREWADGRWQSTLAVFQITKENLVVAHPDGEVLANNPFAQLQLGEAQSRGIEFDLQGEILPGLQLILNYANTEVKITEDTDETLIGSRIAGHARHMTNGWLRYQFQQKQLSGFGLSLGYQYQVDRASWNWGANNESPLPDYFRLDGALSWRNNNFELGLNVNNLLDEYLYSGSQYNLGGTEVYYWQSEPGTNFRINLGYKF